MNNSGQTAIGSLLVMGMVLIIVVVWGYPALADAGQQGVTLNSLSGFEAFFYGMGLSLTMLVFIAAAIIGTVYYANK